MELTLGGAEMMLWKLVSRLDRSRFDPLVVALSSRVDGMLDLFDRADVPYHIVGMRSSMDASALFRLIAVLRKFQPAIIQGWMYHGNLAATCAGYCAPGRPAVMWNIRGTLNLPQEKRLSALLIRLSGKLSFLPQKIVNNSLESAIEHEEELGYRPLKRVILPNGFDTDVFCPSIEARRSFRTSLSLQEDTVLVGLIGRYHAMKDHGNFLHAAALLSPQFPHVHFVLAGENVDADNAHLSSLITSLGLNDRTHLLGVRSDMSAVTAALDIAVSSSSGGEGFPNVIGEAMSCGVPCVVTEVGASASVVGDTGASVPPRDPQRLARAIADFIEAGPDRRRELGRRARERIMEQFSLETVVEQYQDLYMRVYDEELHHQRD